MLIYLEARECRKLTNNPFGNHIDSFSDIEATFSQLVWFLLSDLKSKTNTGRFKKKHRDELFAMFRRANEDIDNFSPLRAISFVLEEYNSIIEIPTEKKRNLLVGLAIEHLLHCCSSSFPLLVTAHHNISDTLYIFTNSNSLVSSSYSLFYDEKLVINSVSLSTAFVHYIIFHDILFMTCENEHVYTWFNKVLLHGTFGSERRIPEKMYALNTRLAKWIQNSLQDWDFINVSMLLSRNMCVRSDAQQPRKKRRRLFHDP
eukprot:gb/GECH01005215.1/.p1 GENE.gb/GECH01005215.1/~~gb/GECH01005215.1/.p1  ORF type:complete len:259 (+),score=-0.05 gb/GECH01005215.1/:1-777(+)